MQAMRTEIGVLISAMRILAEEIQSDDGVANAAIAEAADRLEELKKYQNFYFVVSCLITDFGESNTKTELYDAIKKEMKQCHQQ